MTESLVDESRKEVLSDADVFFNIMESQRVGLTFGDVLLRSNYSRELLPGDVSLETRFSRNVSLKMPIASAAMDTVTEHKMAIAIAIAGGIGVIHRNGSPEQQADEVDRVKFSLNGRIEKPICIKDADWTMTQVLTWRREKQYRFSSFPVLDKDGKLIGLITGDDFRFLSDENMSRTVRQVTKQKVILTAGPRTTEGEAFTLLSSHQKKILPLIDADGKLVGIYTFADLKRIKTGSMHNVDARGNLRVAAAIGVGNAAIDRAEVLVKKHVDALVIDTAHAYTSSVMATLRELKHRFPETDVIVGNVSEEDAARYLVRAGADGVKVGQGVGSICMTGMVTGVGRAQLTALYWSARGIKGNGSDVPVCADGGIRSSGDIALALAVGAESVMLGRLLAGAIEAPGRIIVVRGQRMKEYNGMGSARAIKGNADRYPQGGKVINGIVVPEGVEAWVPLLGPVSAELALYLGGLRKGMSESGAAGVRDLQKKARFERLTVAAAAESRPHDVTVIEEALISSD